MVEQEWTDLDQVATDLTNASKQLHSAFAALTASSTHASRDALLLHDPTDILERISSLENQIEHLRVQCANYIKLRPLLAQEITSSLIENFQAMEEISVLVNGANASVDPIIQRVAQQVHSQNQSWARINCSRKISTGVGNDSITRETTYCLP